MMAPSPDGASKSETLTMRQDSHRREDGNGCAGDATSEVRLSCLGDKGGAELDNGAAGEIKDRDSSDMAVFLLVVGEAGLGWRGKAVKKVRSL